MPADGTNWTILIGLGLLTILLVLRRTTRLRFPLDGHVAYVWTFFLFFGIAEWLSFRLAIWILAVLCFVALKEYFTLVDIRWQDRWALFGAYAAIPFTLYFVQIQWYGMFIISIPVYGYLVVPFLVAMGGKDPRGSVLSIGIIDFGLFLFVYCVGHIGYLALYSVRWAMAVLLGVLVSDLSAAIAWSRRAPGLARTALRCTVAIPAVAALLWALSGWSGIPARHSAILGASIPLLAAIGRYTIAYLEADLGIDRASAVPGKGRIVDSLRSFLYVSPVAFHYLRYFLT